MVWVCRVWNINSDLVADFDWCHLSPLPLCITMTARNITHTYVCMYMSRKVSKTLSIPLDVAKQLEEEDNQSQTVTVALQQYWEDANDD